MSTAQHKKPILSKSRKHSENSTFLLCNNFLLCKNQAIPPQLPPPNNHPPLLHHGLRRCTWCRRFAVPLHTRRPWNLAGFLRGRDVKRRFWQSFFFFKGFVLFLCFLMFSLYYYFCVFLGFLCFFIFCGLGRFVVDWGVCYFIAFAFGSLEFCFVWSLLPSSFGEVNIFLLFRDCRPFSLGFLSFCISFQTFWLRGLFRGAPNSDEVTCEE